MSNSERLAEVLAPVFGDQETVVDEALVERMAAGVEPLISDDFVVVMSGAEGFEREDVGAAGLRDAWRDWLATFERVTFEIESIEDVGGNVLTQGRQVGVTRHGGVPIEQPSAAVWKFRGDRLCRLEFHLDRERARRSAQESA
jgi:ketosteroid isomerase-like protein